MGGSLHERFSRSEIFELVFNGQFHFISAHPPVEDTYALGIPLSNPTFKTLNPWGIPAWKTWTGEEFQPQKPEPLKNSGWKNLHEHPRNCSLKNLNTQGIPASKILTPEVFQSDYFGTPEDFQSDVCTAELWIPAWVNGYPWRITQCSSTGVVHILNGIAQYSKATVILQHKQICLIISKDLSNI